MEPFRHTPLDQNKTQFRLLCLESIDVNSGESIDIKKSPAELYDMINCSLQHFEFCQEGLPDYKAISYTWGSETPLYTVLVNGKPFSVRQNLWRFLQQYSLGLLDLESSLIWVDQICIDQESLSEKGHQLGLMSSIYSQASQVISWLGTSAYREGTSLHATRTFFADPYWTRLWVAQEIMLAREWIVLHDGAAIPGDEIIDTISNYTPLQHVAPARWVLHRTALAFGVTPPSLAVAIACFAHLQCHDPRDKVFALLALTRDRAALDLDYNLSPTTIFWSAFQALERLGAGFIDPSRIAQIARDMHVVDEQLVKTDEGLGTSRFQYLSMQEIRRRITDREVIMCAPWTSHERPDPHDEVIIPAFAIRWATPRYNSNSAWRLPSLKCLFDDYSTIMTRAEQAQQHGTVSIKCLADLRTVLDNITEWLQGYHTMTMKERTELDGMRDALRRREVQFAKSLLEDDSLERRQRRELTHFLARHAPNLPSSDILQYRKAGGTFYRSKPNPRIRAALSAARSKSVRRPYQSHRVTEGYPPLGKRVPWQSA